MEEVERRLMTTARELVDEYGLTVSFDHLPMDDLVRAAGVSRSSVYRRWPSREDFFAEFLAALVTPAGPVGATYDERTSEGAEAVVRDADPAALKRSEEYRKKVFATAIMRGVRRNFEALSADQYWKTYTALVATVGGSQNEHIREAVRDALRQADRQYVDAMASLYDRLLPALQLRWKLGFTARMLATAGAAVIEGLVQRHTINPDLVDVQVAGPVTLDGGQQWNLAELSFLALAESMTESAIEPTTTAV